MQKYAQNIVQFKQNRQNKLRQSKCSRMIALHAQRKKFQRYSIHWSLQIYQQICFMGISSTGFLNKFMIVGQLQRYTNVVRSKQSTGSQNSYQICSIHSFLEHDEHGNVEKHRIISYQIEKCGRKQVFRVQSSRVARYIALFLHIAQEPVTMMVDSLLQIETTFK
ncbi:Hypothetical_protein [Hexamita inflata]|uniref:Hypothetical_protein n=1 Tax=Hexamita inflata TaxID=28002 RepID=A0AA86RUA2_9EUKA|nr:Hypothetical protein HINF_LOCUS65797 [Hexamita inflata]